MAERSDDARDWKNKVNRLYGSVPWLKVTEKRRHRGKVFRSGNSLAFRIPAGTRLVAGMEMELTIEDGQFLSLEPVEQPRRKFNIGKVAGSARNLELLPDEDRLFVERPLLWDDPERRGNEQEP
jgi:antitoxin VapB